MILGIDHIAISTPTLGDAARSLESAGCEVAFIENDIPNGEPKRDLLSRYTPLHSIALCRPPRGIAIELTQHATMRQNQGGYQLLLDGPLPIPSSTNTDVCAQDEWQHVWQSAGWNETARHHSFASMANMLTSGAESCPSIQAIGCHVSDIDKSSRFWRDGFRFRSVARGESQHGNRWERLSFRSIQPNWGGDLVLVESTSASVAVPMLDDEGATCLAILTTDIEADLARVDHATTTSFELEVAGKRLMIALLRAPSGEIVELIQPPFETSTARRSASMASTMAQQFT